MKKLLLLLLFVSNLTFGQFSESFEGGIPASWTVLAGGDTAETWGIRDLYTTTNTVTAQNGTKSVAIFSDEVAHDDYLVTPQITVVSGVSDKLTFWARGGYYNGIISVKASTTTATASAMTTVLEATIAPGDYYFTKYTIDLTSLVGQSIYVGFHSATISMSDFDIDNVVVGATQSCSEPEFNLYFAGITTNSVFVLWSAPTPAPALGYEVYISTSATAPTAATTATETVTSGTSLSISGLNDSTKYYVYVRSKCSASNSSVWGHVGTFLTVTVFAPVSPPYSFNFDGDSVYQDYGWNGDSWINYMSADSQSGSYMTGSLNNPDYQINSWLYSRAITLQANSVNTINFYLKNYSGNLPQSFKLTVGSTPTNAAQTTTLYSTTTFANTTWTLVTATYTPTETGVYYFGFNHFSPAQPENVMLGLDTFSISSVLDTAEFKLDQFSVFPNPTNAVLNVKIDKQISAINVVDISGRTTAVKVLSETSIDVSSLANGVYFIEISTMDGQFRKKFIKN